MSDACETLRVAHCDRLNSGRRWAACTWLNIADGAHHDDQVDDVDAAR